MSPLEKQYIEKLVCSMISYEDRKAELMFERYLIKYSCSFNHIHGSVKDLQNRLSWDFSGTFPNDEFKFKERKS